jgi:hypothetical protein
MNGAPFSSAAANSSVRRLAAFLIGDGLFATAGQRDCCEPIKDRAEERNDNREAERRDGAGKLFIARGIEGIDDERGRSDSEKDGDE